MTLAVSSAPANLAAIYEQEVLLKYQIYNGLFLELPFADPDNAGSLLPIFNKRAQEQLQSGKTAVQIVTDFLAMQPLARERQLNLLFKFLQFIERQVVLFDALEDSAFASTHDQSGYGTLDYLLHQLTTERQELMPQLTELLLSYRARLVLTAHPTQFYPPHILSIITDLEHAIVNNDLVEIRNLFLQLGLSHFGNRSKPTPLDEARSVIWFLEHVFYPVMPQIQGKLNPEQVNLELGFWPGGDRDGNPFVTAKTTNEVARQLRQAILQCYVQDLKKLQHRLTFAIVSDQLAKIKQRLKFDEYANPLALLADLQQVVQTLDEKYLGTFSQQVNELILKVRIFGFHFAKLDIRQNSAIHRQVIGEILASHGFCDDYLQLADSERVSCLHVNAPNFKLAQQSELAQEIVATFQTIAAIQEQSGLQAIERYIISNADTVACVIEVIWLARLVCHNYNCQLKLEVVPLFETIDDLACADQIMASLYQDQLFQANLQQQNQQQTIMLGFSDGTKDGGYLMANWAIFQAKKRLTKQAAQVGVQLVFFDGRGGPPARGGGDTHSFYQSLAQEIGAQQIQLTIQGQTISANFGRPDLAQYQIEHLLSAGLMGHLFRAPASQLNQQDESLIEELAHLAYRAYNQLRHDPLFVPYLEQITPLKYLSEANIGSRPAKRNKDGQLKLADLRAIPFGGAWMQMKQNILGFYGMGSALAQLINEQPPAAARLQQLYRRSLLFRGLIDNSLQSLATTNFNISSHLASDPVFGSFWQKLAKEAKLAREMLLLVADSEHVLDPLSLKCQSFEMREKIILPLLLIQQYAMDQLRYLDSASSEYHLCEKIVKKSLATNINASRNSI